MFCNLITDLTMASLTHSTDSSTQLSEELDKSKGKFAAVLTDIVIYHSQEIKSAKEAEFQNRVEVGMDLDDEVPSMAGLIEQPALQMTEGEGKAQQGQDQTRLSPSKAKKRRVEAPGNAMSCYCAIYC